MNTRGEASIQENLEESQSVLIAPEGHSILDPIPELQVPATDAKLLATLGEVAASRCANI